MESSSSRAPAVREQNAQASLRPVPSPTKRTRIGVVLADLGRVRLPPLKYLVLQLNACQEHVEFEIVPTPRADAVLEKLAPRELWDYEAFTNASSAFATRLATVYEHERVEYQLLEGPPSHWVVISLASLEDGYYFAHGASVSLIALGDWKRHMAPPSLLEYLLTLLIVEGLEVAAPVLGDSPFHLGTKSCVRDFNADVADIKYKALSGYLCSTCRALLDSDEQRVADDFARILSKQWLGQLSDPYSPAHVAASLGYNLFATKGAVPTWGEAFRAKLRDDGIKEGLKVIGGVALAFLLGVLALKR